MTCHPMQRSPWATWGFEKNRINSINRTRDEINADRAHGLCKESPSPGQAAGHYGCRAETGSGTSATSRRGLTQWLTTHLQRRQGQAAPLHVPTLGLASPHPELGGDPGFGPGHRLLPLLECGRTVNFSGPPTLLGMG